MVLDRLEEGGFIRRERDPKDRRRVIVNLKAGLGRAEIAPTFGPLVKAWRDTAAGYADEELRLLLEFQRKLVESCAASWHGCAAISISMAHRAGRRRR